MPDRKHQETLLGEIPAWDCGVLGERASTVVWDWDKTSSRLVVRLRDTGFFTIFRRCLGCFPSVIFPLIS